MRAARPVTLAIAYVALHLLGPVTTPASAGTSGGGGGSTCPGFASGPRIEMRDSCFGGTAHLVAPGTSELTVVNVGEAPHTITAVDGSFDLRLEAGETGSLALPDAPVVPVYCTLHGTRDGVGMAGAIVVDSAAAAAGSASGSAPNAADAAALRTSTAGADTDDGLGVGWAVVGAAAVAGMGGLGALGLSSRRRRVTT